MDVNAWGMTSETFNSNRKNAPKIPIAEKFNWLGETHKKVSKETLVIRSSLSILFSISLAAKFVFFVTIQNSWMITSSGSSGRVRGGPRNMKSMWPPSAAIFFMTYFHRARGGHGPLGSPLDPLLITKDILWPSIQVWMVTEGFSPNIQLHIL